MCFLKSRKGLDFRRSIRSKNTSIIQSFTGTRQHASKGNVLAKQYLDKLRKEEYSLAQSGQHDQPDLSNSGERKLCV
jgi:hypothetical protein